MPTHHRATKKMYFNLFIIWILFNVIVVQPINGAANATQQTAKDNGDKNEQANVAFGEAGTYKIDSPLKQMQQVHQVKVSNSLVQLLAQNNLNGSDLSVKHRGVTKVDIAPPADENHDIKNSTINNNDKIALQSNISKTVANANVNTNQNVESAPKQTSAATSASNSQSKAANLEPAQPLATSSTTSTTTTSTTPKPIQAPKKPPISYSVEDVPGLVSKAAEAQPAKEAPIDEIRDNEPLSLQSSETITYPDQRSSHNYVMSIVGVLVIVPILVLVTNCAVKRARDYWSKRRYRRMDYLIEDMYN